MSLLTQFQQNWLVKKFPPKSKSILLAVSGGIDSMVMADLFLRAEMNFGVAHCNFQLRGIESDGDEELVSDWCKTNNIPFYSCRFDTNQYVLDWKKGIQETARILRYEWLEMIRATNRFECIATAHHANDNIETLLMNLFKGTGINGLHGIPETNGAIIRPLLFAEKDDVVHYAKQNHVSYRDDASNATDKYLRNAVRLHVVPTVKEWFPNVVPNLKDSITRFSQAAQLYQKAIEKEKKRLLEKRGNDYYVPVLKLRKTVPLETVCYELFSSFGFSSASVPEILKLLESESGHYISSGTHRIIRNRDFLIVTLIDNSFSDFIVIEGAPCSVHVGNQHFKFSMAPRPNIIPNETDTAIIDAKAIQFPLIIRKWKTGDYFYPLGMGMKKKKLSKYFIDQKIPLHEKEQIRVLESNRKIVWISGMRLDERFKVKSTTDQVLVVRIDSN